ncbi:hypothetical protein ACXN5S_12255 [Pseudoroseicyclus sp. H15]
MLNPTFISAIRRAAKGAIHLTDCFWSERPHGAAAEWPEPEICKHRLN